MDSTQLIRRMALHPDPTGLYHRMYRRLMLMPIQPEDDPDVVTVRPYGISKYLGMSTFPLDYTMMHYGGTLRGAKIGQWRSSLLVAPDPQPVNAPTMFSWHPSQNISKFGTMWVEDDPRFTVPEV